MEPLSPTVNIQWLPLASRVKLKLFCLPGARHDWALITFLTFSHSRFHCSTQPEPPWDLGPLTSGPSELSLFLHSPPFLLSPMALPFSLVGRGTLSLPPSVCLENRSPLSPLTSHSKGTVFLWRLFDVCYSYEWGVSLRAPISVLCLRGWF